MINFEDVPDYKYLRYFLSKHDLDDYMEATVLSNNAKEICLRLDFGALDVIDVRIRRRKGENGNYRITMME